MSANEMQVGGKHYQATEGEQHWDRVLRLGLDYFQAQITKYVERCWLKNGIEDLEKALHFIQKYIEVSRAAGRRGAKQDVIDLSIENPTDEEDAFRWMLKNYLVSPTGTISINGQEWPCIKGVPSDFEKEGGFGDGRDRWKCTRCRSEFVCKGHELPWVAHVCQPVKGCMTPPYCTPACSKMGCAKATPNTHPDGTLCSACGEPSRPCGKAHCPAGDATVPASST